MLKMDLMLYVTADDETCYNRKPEHKLKFESKSKFIETQQRFKASFVDHCLTIDNDWILLDGNQPAEKSAQKAFKAILYYLSCGHKPRNVHINSSKEK